MFTIAGQKIGWTPPSYPIAVFTLKFGGGIIAVVGIVTIRKRLRSRKYKQDMGLFEELLIVEKKKR